jgi:hypothetical protein
MVHDIIAGHVPEILVPGTPPPDVLEDRVHYFVDQGAHQPGNAAGFDQALDKIIVINEVKTLGPHG